MVKHSWKPFCQRLFSSSVAFLMTSLASKNRRPFVTAHSFVDLYETYLSGIKRVASPRIAMYQATATSVLDHHMSLFHFILYFFNGRCFLYIEITKFTPPQKKRKKGGKKGEKSGLKQISSYSTYVNFCL